MTESKREFSPRCGKCRQRTMTLAAVDYATQFTHDGRQYSFTIPGLVVPRCGNCGEISLDPVATEQITAAFRKQAGLLAPEQIREQRQALRLTQQELADLLGIGVHTLCRWETGGQIQQRAFDRILRAFFKVPELRQALADESRLVIPETGAA
jgi:putative zinc finger/helix-turn-helix YgiT family protein